MNSVKNNWIETYTGKKAFLAAPEANIEDIAHSLANLCRFNGHCSKFYSVAEHSVLVAELMETLGLGDPFEGLMHDAVETYLSDVPMPFKAELPDWKKAEDKLDLLLRRQWGLPETKSEGCHWADMAICLCEAHYLMPNKGRNFQDPLGIRFTMEPLYKDFRPECLTPWEAKSYFLEKYAELKGDTREVKGKKRK